MRTHHLHMEQWVPRAPEEIFPFFADAANLEAITPGWLRFRIVENPGEIRQGTIINYKLRVRGIPLRWQSEISEWQPPYRFVDVQLKGPYRLWIHEHRFEPREGGTLVCDDVQYAVAGGRLIAKFFVTPDLERIFSFRRSRVQALFG